MNKAYATKLFGTYNNRRIKHKKKINIVSRSNFSGSGRLRLLTVNTHMPSQLIWTRERFTAARFGADVWPFPGMGAQLRIKELRISIYETQPSVHLTCLDRLDDSAKPLSGRVSPDHVPNVLLYIPAAI